MRPSSTVQVGVGTSPAVVVDIYSPSSEKAIQVNVTGTATYSVEMTLDDVFDTRVTPVWLATGLANLTGATTSQIGELTIPCRALRLNVTAGTGRGSMTVVQQGIF